MLVALDAEVEIRDGAYTSAMADLLQPPSESRRTETLLEPGVLITSLRIPPPAPGTRMTYLKAMDRKIWAFALVGMAATLRMEGQRVADARLVLSGVANVPMRSVAAEDALIGATVDPGAIDRAAELALDDARPLGDNRYKLPLARALIRRALTTLSRG